ncbi:MAG: nickel pincer cofactor biosynthesis protein LarB [Pseudomonadota bacterium]
MSQDLGHTTVDLERAARTGAPEVIYGSGKSAQEVIDIARALYEAGQDVLATRIDADKAATVRQSLDWLAFNPHGRLLSFLQPDSPNRPGQREIATSIAVVSAGTSDGAVAEEAAATCEFYGHPVLRVNDVGVAGLHRLLARIDEIRTARVIVVVAGMEGALPSVLGGLVDKPVIAVPTSIGYGAAFGGLAALLGMLNTCASGVSVVNIDNGFGAGYLASMINAL